MLKKKERQRHAFLLFCDTIAILLALPAAYLLRRGLRSAGGFLFEWVQPEIPSVESFFWFYSVSLTVILLFYFYQNKRRVPSRFRYLPRHILVLAEECLLIGFIIGFFSFVLKLDLSRSVTFLFLLALFLFGTLHRLLHVLWFKSRKGLHSEYRRILVAGNSPKVFEMGEHIARHQAEGYYLVGYVTDCERPEGNSFHGPMLGGLQDFEAVLDGHVVDEVMFISSSNGDLKLFENVALLCENQGVITRLSLNFFPHSISRTSLDFIEDQPFLSFSPVPERALALMVKRVIDLVGATVGIVLSIPLFVVLPILIRLSSQGPAIHKQVRCGRNGRKFTLYKFRSMSADAEDRLWEIKHLNEMSGPVFKMHNDPRVTPLGRILRKTSLDEVPQFFNILKGEMSLVGPRAPLPDEVQEYTRWQRRRLSVKPGLTCLWQVSGRNEIQFDEWMKLDLYYIDNWSLFLDLRILLQTVPTVLFCRGAK